MFDDVFRPRFARVVAPVGRALISCGITPSLVTWAGFFLALAGAGAITVGYPLSGLALWLVSRVADGLDGVIARQSRRQSAFGGYLDLTLDMAAYSAMVLAFSSRHPEHALLWQVVLVGYVLVITTTLAFAAAAERAQQARRPATARSRSPAGWPRPARPP